MDYLDRESAPFTKEDWANLDNAVIVAARQQLVGRKMIDVLGPLGSGIYTLPYSVFGNAGAAEVNLTGDKEGDVVAAENRKMAQFPLIYKDFKIQWRDVETDRKLGLPLDVSAAAVAAEVLSVQEDELVFRGNEELGQEGLLNAKGRLIAKAADWNVNGGALDSIVAAVSKLTSAGYYGPYALAVSPVLFGRMIRVHSASGILELDQIKTLVGGGVYATGVLKDNEAVLVAAGAQNVSLAIGQDMVTAYLGPVSMNHMFRVMETCSLLIRRPNAICTIE
ncbi:MAG: family 1 encapsulin nanocompartment shell protein [Sporomusaceae bacterium]|nr:family 1 encapsulin nanocompartment shell protein [Sporomusaceae bacterium]